ncbi:MAG: hypothetical protein P1U36_08750 [Legionellaceae bacterium]|nr:hypothetical protein [Legionellaceae bacterium]
MARQNENADDEVAYRVKVLKETLRACKPVLNELKSNADVLKETFVDTVTELIHRVEQAYSQKAIYGLLTTMAIVSTVVIALALAGPSMGTSLLCLLPLALIGAGCGIPSALREHAAAENAAKHQVSKKTISGYKQDLQKAYQDALPKEEGQPEGERPEGASHGKK